MKSLREDVMEYDFLERNIEFVVGHYQMPLPWKNNAVTGKSCNGISTIATPKAALGKKS